MIRLFIVLFLFVISSLVKSQDSCSFKFKVDCPISEIEFWKGIAILKNNDSTYFFPFYNTIKKIPYGKYKMTIYSQFGHKIDTTITLYTKSQTITIPIDWKYQFNEYSNMLFGTDTNAIIIKYEYKYCCGGINCSNWDKIELNKKPTGQYLLKYYNNIYTENIFENNEMTLNEKLLDLKKNQIIQNYLTKNNVNYDKHKIIECTVVIGRQVYAMRNGSYITFKEDLLK